MKHTIKIQSLSDIITNSSSETYIVLKYDSVNAVKEIIDSILALAGSNRHWNDFFEIKEIIDDKNWAIELYKEKNWDEEFGTFEEPEYDELIEFVHNLNECNWYDSDEPILDTSLSITPINPESEKAAKLLKQLNNLFDFQERYNG